MKRQALLVLALLCSAAMIISCNGKKSGKHFTVSGKISNSGARVLYLEEVPVATMQRIVVDSALLGKDGAYSLKTDTKEASVYNLRLDQQEYPLASVINDAPNITVNANNTGNQQPGQDYEVKGSEASRQMKDFMAAFNNDLVQLMVHNKNSDSLRALPVTDSVTRVLDQEKQRLLTGMRDKFNKLIQASNNPALTMFALGYFQSTANNASFGLAALDIQEVKQVVEESAAKFPEHQGLAFIKAAIAMQLEGQSSRSTWVGKEAPEIVLPDVNGKEVRLSSFKGKYVLVDFWASWCKPCRFENPAVVDAYTKYRDKNFDVLGVSLDKKKEEWLQAIKEDQLTWTHVSDLKFWDSPVVPLYGFDGIPFNVLVDPAGKVVAEGLRGAALEAKLAEVLK